MFVGYLRDTSNYLERIALSDQTHTMNMVDLIAISSETLRKNNGCSFEKEFTKLTCRNP